MGRFTRRRVAVGASVLAAVLVVAAGWWWRGSDSATAPQPLTIECRDRGLTDLLAAPEQDHHGDHPAPAAARTEPTLEVREGADFSFDYQTPEQRNSPAPHGFRLDPDSGHVSLAQAQESHWSTRINDQPLHDLYHIITQLPGRQDLLAVSARQRADGALQLAVLRHDDGTLLLSCATDGAPGSGGFGVASLSRSGSTLLTQDFDESGHPWVAAHLTDGGGHLWSAPGIVVAADRERAYVLDELRVTAYDLTTGEAEWERDDIEWYGPGRSPQRPHYRELPAPSAAIVGDELYLYPAGVRRLVTLERDTGRSTGSLMLGDPNPGMAGIVPFDDRSVVVHFGDYGTAVHGGSDWSWLGGRGADYLRTPELVRTRQDAPPLLTLRHRVADHSVVTVHEPDSDAEPVFSLAIEAEEYSVEVADSAIYVLDRTALAVTAYDLASAEALWSIDLPELSDERLLSFTAVDGGFLLAAGGVKGTAYLFTEP